MASSADIVAAAGRGRLGRVYRYGDLSQAVYGHRKAGQAIAQVARNEPSFPCATHFVPNDWRLGGGFVGALGSGRAHWIARLRADGIPIDEDGVVPLSHRGDWRDLVGIAVPPVSDPQPTAQLTTPSPTRGPPLTPPSPALEPHSRPAIPGSMTFIGLDLAWGQNARTGACAISEGRVVASASLKTDEEILDWLGQRASGPCLVAIDAPLVVANAAGRRPCESIVTRWLGKRDAGAHSSNASMPAFVTGSRGARIASALGLSIDPLLPADGVTRGAIEVYPHPALVVLFGLSTIVKYKAKAGRTIDGRRVEFRRLMELLESLGSASPAMDVRGPRWSALRGEVENATTQSGLDRAEDEIDAYVCGYTALFHWSHGAPRSRVIGTLQDGYIVTPLADALGAIDDEVRAGLEAAIKHTQEKGSVVAP